MGQEVNKDMVLVDELVEQTDGDLAEAEDKFQEQSAGATPDPGNVPRKDGQGHS